MPNVTLKEIAEKCNVSAQTVSRVINNHPNISEKKRKKVLETIAAMKYFPSDSARTLRYGGKRPYRTSAMRIGYIIPPPAEDYLIFSQERQQIQNALSRNNCIQSFYLTSETLLADRCLFNYLVNPDTLDGIFVNTMTNELEQAFRQVLPAGFPIVSFSQTSIGIEVKIDLQNAMRDAMIYLYELGHREIGFLGVKHYLDGSVNARYLWFCNLAQELGLKIHDEWIPDGGSFSKFNSGEELAAKLLACSSNLPTALIAAGTALGLSAAGFLLHHKIRIPGDISLIALGSSYINQLFMPSITALSVDYDFVGDEIARLLQAQSSQMSDLPQMIPIHCALTPRESCRKL